MADTPFLGEIRLFPNEKLTPSPGSSWTLCDGKKFSVAQFPALFKLLGFTYGGNSKEGFAVPNLVGLATVGAGSGSGLSSYALGGTAGAAAVQLTADQMAPHTHSLNGSNILATEQFPEGKVLAEAGLPGGRNDPDNKGYMYSPNAASVTTAFAASSIGTTGGGGSHGNMQPYVPIYHFIAIEGILPATSPEGAAAATAPADRGLGDEQILGQVSLFASAKIPRGWLVCDGAELRINSYSSLFKLIGTTFGGDGVTTFRLPNLKGSCVIGAGGDYKLGASGGAALCALAASEIPAHSHTLYGDAGTPAASSVRQPIGNGLGAGQVIQAKTGNTYPYNPYTTDASVLKSLDGSSIGTTGGDAHPNVMPSLALNYCICVLGVSAPTGAMDSDGSSASNMRGDDPAR